MLKNVVMPYNSKNSLSFKKDISLSHTRPQGVEENYLGRRIQALRIEL